MKGNRTALLVALLCLLPLLSIDAAPEVHQFFPSKTLLLGQPLFWSVKLRHPLSESYDLHLPQISGLRMEIAGRRIFEEGGEISTIYTIRVSPEELRVSTVPYITITDQKGQSTVITGKPLNIMSISGSSLEIKPPGTPLFASGRSTKARPLWIIAVLAFLVALFFYFRARWQSPRARLLRDFQKAQREIRRGRLPFSLWSTLRSPLLWGFSAECRTGIELEQAAGSNSRLVAVAELIQSMERARYAGKTVFPETYSERSILAAMELLNLRRSKE